MTPRKLTAAERKAREEFEMREYLEREELLDAIEAGAPFDLIDDAMFEPNRRISKRGKGKK